MQIIFYIIIGIFALLGIGSLNAAFQTNFRHFGLILGGISYLGGAVAAYALSSWWPFLIGFGLAWIIRMIGGDPGN